MNGMKRIVCIIVVVSLLIMADFSVAQADTLPDSYYISGVIGHPQNYSISCESRSAADLAGFWGVSVGETEFLQALPRSDNPDEGFVGEPNEVWGRIPPHGYGVHADPVAETLRNYGVQAEAQHGLSWDDLRGEISAGRPVIVWVIGSMWPGSPVDYQAADGSTSRVAAFEHTFLLTGYGSDSVEVIDAYSGQNEYYWLSSFLDSWDVLGNMAVFASGSSQPEEEPQRETTGGTYTVQPGDYLMQLARQFNTSWLELAQLNSIEYPYVIFAGQVLTLPDDASVSTVAEPETEIATATPAPVVKETISWSRLPIIQRGSPALRQGSTDASTDAQPVKTVVVLNTNTLIGFARSIGVAWHVLAELNDLPPMHLLHPGEILKVR